LAGNVLYAASQWAIVVILAKWGTPEIVGEYALGMAIAMPVLMLANLQLRTVLMTDLRLERGFVQYLGFRLATTAGALLFIACLAACMHYPLRSAFTIIAIGAAQCVEQIADIYYGLLQTNNHMDRIAKSMIARAVLSLPAMVIGVWLTGSVLCAVIALAVVRLIILLIYDVRRRTHGMASEGAPSALWPPRWNLESQRKLAALGLPLGIVALLLALNTMLPRYFIEGYLGTRNVGIFAAIAFLPNSGSLLINALGQSAFVALTKYDAENNLTGFLALLAKLLGMGVLLGLGGILFAAVAGRWLLTFVYRPEYGAQAHLLVWFMAAAMLSYLGQLIGTAITAARHFRSQIPLFVIVTGSLALFCHRFVPARGLEGAVLATVAAMTIQLAGCGGLLIWTLHSKRQAMRFALFRPGEA
jgi:O-antigen/teichoic acid export membrane protein